MLHFPPPFGLTLRLSTFSCGELERVTAFVMASGGHFQFRPSRFIIIRTMETEHNLTTFIFSQRNGCLPDFARGDPKNNMPLDRVVQ